MYRVLIYLRDIFKESILEAKKKKIDIQKCRLKLIY